MHWLLSGYQHKTYLKSYKHKGTAIDLEGAQIEFMV